MPLRQRLRQIKDRFIEFLNTWFTVRNIPPSTAPPDPGASLANPPAAASICTQSNMVDNWPMLRSLSRVLERIPFALTFGLKTVVDDLVECIEIYEGAANSRQDFVRLRADLESLFKELEQHVAHSAEPALTASVGNLCRSIQKELEWLKRKQSREPIKRHLEARHDSDAVLACYRRLQRYLQHLSVNANISMWGTLHVQTTNARLRRLRPPSLARYNSTQAEELRREECTPGTRVGVLSHTHDWIRNPKTPSVYWLSGMAGTGKTAIAHSLCAQLDATFQLGASFFCSRSLPGCQKVKLILPSIAYQLAHFSCPFRYALSRVLEKDQDAHDLMIRLQFEMLIVKPLVEVREELPGGLVVVIDGLDECDNQQDVGRILDALFTMTPDLPIKFFISTRPEPEIRDQMRNQGNDHQSTSRLILHELDKAVVQKDIEVYFREALKPANLSDPEIAKLVERAGALFIYAATVTRYIGYDNFRRNPRARLKAILSASSEDEDNPYRELDDLYTIILKAAIGDPNLSRREKDDIKQILNTAICVREPLTIDALSSLLGLHDIERVHAALRPLWSVLHILETSELVKTPHSSFTEYMFDSRRSKEFYCDSSAHNRVLAQCCFNCIKDMGPQLGASVMGGARTDRIQNNTVEDAISSGLRYACRHWGSHLEQVKQSSDIAEQLEDFLSERLLSWVKLVEQAECREMLRRAESWCIRQGCPEGLTLKCRPTNLFLGSDRMITENLEV